MQTHPIGHNIGVSGQIDLWCLIDDGFSRCGSPWLKMTLCAWKLKIENDIVTLIENDIVSR